MKKISYLLVAAVIFSSCSETKKTGDKMAQESTAAVPLIKEEMVSYKADTTTMNSFIAWDESGSQKRPVVLVIPEWWGLNGYVKDRARQLAAMGYIAIAVDMYGNGTLAETPDAAQKMSTPFYTNTSLTMGRFDAALNKVKTYAVADTGRVAAIGYCFGGAVVLNVARMGANLDGVVSFHGSLVGVPANKDLLRSAILVCHGEADSFVPDEQVAQFKKQLDSISYPYTFKSYPGATHAFTNPAATETGKKFSIPIAYNAAADTASWNDMKDFFARIFK